MPKHADRDIPLEEADSLVDGTGNLRLRKLAPPARKRAEDLIAGARTARESRTVRPPEDVKGAQGEYDQTPELRELLADAATSPSAARTVDDNADRRAIARRRTPSWAADALAENDGGPDDVQD
jgi:hypothetical protein